MRERSGYPNIIVPGPEALFLERPHFGFVRDAARGVAGFSATNRSFPSIPRRRRSLPDVHDRSFYLDRAEAEARAAEIAPSREIAVLHLQLRAMYLRRAAELEREKPSDGPRMKA